MTVSLVTGGSGFVGAAIARALKARGDRVIVLDLAPDMSRRRRRLSSRRHPRRGGGHRSLPRRRYGHPQRLDRSHEAEQARHRLGGEPRRHPEHARGGPAERGSTLHLHQLRERRVRGQGHRERGREPPVLLGFPSALRRQQDRGGEAGARGEREGRHGDLCPPAPRRLRPWRQSLHADAAWQKAATGNCASRSDEAFGFRTTPT